MAARPESFLERRAKEPRVVETISSHLRPLRAALAFRDIRRTYEAVTRISVTYLFGADVTVDFKGPVVSGQPDRGLLDQLSGVGAVFAEHDMDAVRTRLTEMYPGTRALDDGRFNPNNPELVAHSLMMYTIFEAAAQLGTEGTLTDNDSEETLKVLHQFVASALKSDRKGMWRSFFSIPKNVQERMRKNSDEAAALEESGGQLPLI